MDSDKQMFEGDWKCSGCEGAITQLPFQPDPARENELLCRDCHQKKSAAARADRPTFEGDWSCSKCGGSIKELPFEPDPSRLGQLVCRDCFRKQ